MARIVVLGGGVCGLSAGMLLARAGHEITVLERDDVPVPDSIEEAWEGWSRDGVTQFRQAHFLPPGGRVVLEETLPDVFAALVTAGAGRFNALGMFAGDDAPADERFVTFTARRPVFEQVLASRAEAEPALEIRRGVTVREPLIETHDGTPHVTGVRLDGGETIEADLVVDAMGRGSRFARWLGDAAIGPVHEESEDSGFIYYSRFFRSTNGPPPQPIAPLLSPIGTFSILTLPADNDTWSVTTYISSGDRPLKRMREADAWAAVVRACPLHAHWLEGEPISEIMAMGGVVDRYRRPVADGKPLITGLALLGDAWACTNPSLGRGITLGLMHARCLRETIAAHLEDPREFALAWDAITEQQLTPWYRETVEEDRARLHEIDALREGRQPAPPREGPAALRAALLVAMGQDPGLLMAFLESRCCLTPLSEVFAQPGAAERIMALAKDQQGQPLPGPSREELLQLVS
jgi:2-polyprenyl-6-methoxyphenol hydroxylase-like FAD-dependent oxidoreductase